MKIHLLFFSFCLSASCLYSQYKYKVLKHAIASADTVIIINYKFYDNYLKVRSLTLHGKIDSAILKKGKFLSVPLKLELANVLSRKDHLKGMMAVLGGFYPELAIVMWHQGQFSFIEISSACRKISTSKNIGIKTFHTDIRKDTDLHNFLYDLGIRS